MKINSKIKITDLNKQNFIDVLESHNLRVTDENIIKFTEFIKIQAKRKYPSFKSTLDGEFNSDGWNINIGSVIFKCLYNRK